jgi:hypothetical protein
VSRFERLERPFGREKPKHFSSLGIFKAFNRGEPKCLSLSQAHKTVQSIQTFKDASETAENCVRMLWAHPLKQTLKWGRDALG